MHRTARFAVIAALLLAIGMTGSVAASPTKTVNKQDIARKILNTPAGQTLTSSARGYLESVARGDHRLAPDSSGISVTKASKVNAAKGGGGTPLVNVRVNNPANDTHFIDQTTQSETAIAVSGQNVAVGYNTSQHALLLLTAGADLTGYSYSSDGGQTFTDGGVVPNAPGNVNLGDPWLASDSSGAMYYATLTIEGGSGNLLVGVSRSTDGGKTWSPAVAIQPPPGQPFYSADKDSMIAGPGVGNLYVTWDDFTFDPNTGAAYSGLPVAHSTDGGKTWTVTYAAKVPIFDPSQPGCSFSQFIGGQSLLAGGSLYESAELISSNDPTCSGAPVTFSEAAFISNDGGATWRAGTPIAVTSSTPQGSGVFMLGPAMFMRNLEFPTMAALNNKAYIAWNDGGDGSGHSHIRLAQLDGSANFTKVGFISSGTNDEVQPALSADSALHVAYYQISTDSSGNGQLDVFISNSNNGNSFKVQRVTSQSFPGVFTLPQFDPIIAFTYMGDYIASVSDGQHQYVAWGDNRDIVTNVLWPQGRHDPDVFFARQ